MFPGPRVFCPLVSLRDFGLHTPSKNPHCHTFFVDSKNVSDRPHSSITYAEYHQLPGGCVAETTYGLCRFPDSLEEPRFLKVLPGLQERGGRHGRRAVLCRSLASQRRPGGRYDDRMWFVAGGSAFLLVRCREARPRHRKPL